MDSNKAECSPNWYMNHLHQARIIKLSQDIFGLPECGRNGSICYWKYLQQNCPWFLINWENLILTNFTDHFRCRVISFNTLSWSPPRPIQTHGMVSDPAPQSYPEVGNPSLKFTILQPLTEARGALVSPRALRSLRTTQVIRRIFKAKRFMMAWQWHSNGSSCVYLTFNRAQS